MVFLLKHWGDVHHAGDGWSEHRTESCLSCPQGWGLPNKACSTAAASGPHQPLSPQPTSAGTFLTPLPSPSPLKQSQEMPVLHSNILSVAHECNPVTTPQRVRASPQFPWCSVSLTSARVPDPGRPAQGVTSQGWTGSAGRTVQPLCPNGMSLPP